MESIADPKKLKSLYSRKKSAAKEKFLFTDFDAFTNWYNAQGNTCFYCGVEQHKITALVSAGLLKHPDGLFSKRFHKRGRTLEIDRKNAVTNEYSTDNCVLACYFCNNDKSDIFTHEEYKQYMKPVLYARKQLIEKKYAELINSESTTTRS